jgi:ribosome-binding factor A
MKQAPQVAGQRSQQESNMRHKRSTPNRSNRVNDQIQRDVAELIRDLKDPRIGNMVTITNVEVTPDYAHAKVYFSLLVGDPKACEEGLNEAAGFIRNGLFKRLQIHTVPTLHFHFDRTTERALELSAIITRAVADKAKDAEPDAPAAQPKSDTDEAEDDQP